MFRRCVSGFPGPYRFNAISIHHLTRNLFSIKLNTALPNHNEEQILSRIDSVHSQSGHEGVLQLAEHSFNEQDFNLSALSFEKLIKSHQSDPSMMDDASIYNVYYRFICTLHLLKDYNSAKHYIEDIIIPKFNSNLDGLLYGLYALVLKDGFNDLVGAETNFKKSIELTPGIDNLFSYLNYSAILYNKPDVDWNYLYSFSRDMLEFADFDSYVVAQHGIVCSALHRYDEAEENLYKVIDLYTTHSEQQQNSDKNLNVFLSYFPDLSHVSLRCLLQILGQYWMESEQDSKLLSLYERIRRDHTERNIWISKYLMQILSPIVSQSYWTVTKDQKKAIDVIFENKLLLEQAEYAEELKVMLAFKYWSDLEGLQCGEVLQHKEMVPFYFGCVGLLNGLFEHNMGRWNACKMAFESIPEDQVQSLYDKMEEFKNDKDGDGEGERKKNLLIMDYVHKLMQQMFSVTIGKMAKIAWGNIAIHEFEDAMKIADKILEFERDSVIGYGILTRIHTEQKEYSEAIKVFEEHITVEKCKEDQLMYFNLMPYYSIALCFGNNGERREEGERIMHDLMERVTADEEKEEIAAVHKEQVYKWLGFKMQYLDGDYAKAVECYERSFSLTEMDVDHVKAVKYPPTQMEMAKCFVEIGEMDKAKENMEEALDNGKALFGDLMQREYDSLLQRLQAK